MGYTFDGWFAVAGAGLLRAAQARWRGGRGRLIDTPFQGVGFAAPDPEEWLAVAISRGKDGTAAYDAALALIDRIYAELPGWSRRFPRVTFVYLHADCFGGTCFYDGFVCRNGERLWLVGPGGDEALRQLVAPLGVELDTGGSFAPLSRGYFVADPR